MENFNGNQNLSDEQIYQEISKIVRKFPLLQCDKCAKAILKWLKNNQIEGKLLRLRTKYDEDYIISTRLENRGIIESITYNGIHYGVEIRGKVFDNLSWEGMDKQDWLNDFQCFTQEFIIDELESF
jgi:hypothetical protein